MRQISRSSIKTGPEWLILDQLARLAAVAVLGAFWIAPAHAVEFRLTKGGRYELCRTFHENLKRFPDLPERSMEMPIHPDFTDVFRKVEWEDLNPAKHERVLREIAAKYKGPDWHSMSPGEREAAVEARVKEVLNRAREARIGLGRARIDVNFDGRSETVYRYGFHRWPARYPEPHMTYAWNYHVMPWDQEKAARQMRRYAHGPYDAFHFRGRIYFVSPDARYEINIIEPNDVSTGELALIYVCEFDTVQ